MLWSAAIVYEADFVTMRFWDSSKCTNNSWFCLHYRIVPILNFVADLFFYFIANVACGGRCVVFNFRRFQDAIARNDLKTICNAIDDEVSVVISPKVLYPGLPI